MGFPGLGARISVKHNGVKVTGRLTKIRADQTVYIDRGNGTGEWVPVDTVRRKYGK